MTGTQARVRSGPEGAKEASQGTACLTHRPVTISAQILELPTQRDNELEGLGEACVHFFFFDSSERGE